MLTKTDYHNLLVLLSSPNLKITAAEAQTVALLQHKLRQQLAAKPLVVVEDEDGDDTGPSEQSSDRPA